MDNCCIWFRLDFFLKINFCLCFKKYDNNELLKSIIILLVVFLNSCSQVRESAGVTRKSIDEFQAVENPPLVIPPEFNLIAPDQLEQKNVDDIEDQFRFCPNLCH